MLVRFTSSAAGTLTMFGDVAVELIKMMGASGRIPGAIRAEDVAAAVLSLQRNLAAVASAKPPETEATSDSDPDPEPAVPMRSRALPLIEFLQRSGAANSPVLWDVD